MIRKNYTERTEYLVFLVNPQGEHDTTNKVVIKVPFEKFELYDVNENKVITEYDVLRPNIFSREGEHERIWHHEVHVSLKFKKSDVLKIIKVKKLAELSAPELPSNYDKKSRIEVGSKSLEHLGLTENGTLKFMYKDKDSGISQEVYFSLKYYKAFQGWKTLKEKQDEERRKHEEKIK